MTAIATMTCNQCGASVSRATVAEAIAWSTDHDDHCPAITTDEQPATVNVTLDRAALDRAAEARAAARAEQGRQRATAIRRTTDGNTTDGGTR